MIAEQTMIEATLPKPSVVRIHGEPMLEMPQDLYIPPDLRQAWLTLLARAKLNAHHKVRREELSVREQMTRLLRQLRHGEYETFENLFDVSGGIAQLVVTFIAILELAKEALVEITQTEALGNIYVRASRSINAQ